MGQMGQKVTDGVTRTPDSRQRHLRRCLTAAGAVAALGVLAACSGTVGNTADRAAAGAASFRTAAAGDSVLGTSVPTIISRATAHGKAAEPARRHPHKHVRPRQTASPTASARPSATGTASAAPTSSPTAAPTAAPTATPTGGQSGDPSGQNPATTLSGFSLKYTQEFSGGGTPANWGLYEGVPGGETSQEAQWIPSMCTFSGGEAHFMASGIDSCGMHYQGDAQEYGAWFARLQATNESAGELFSDIFLLWPANNQWPPEIDVYEDAGKRSSTTATLWDTVGNQCGSSPSYQCLLDYTQGNGGSGVANTDTEWHTYGVEWTPSGVSWLIDGRVILTAPASQVKSGGAQPALPMEMALQSQNLQGSPGSPSLATTMNVDWVEQFSWNG
jgi:beta-glucanase (GH16 family)